MMQAPQQLQTAPDLVFAGLSPQQLPGNTLSFDDSKLTNLPKDYRFDKDGVKKPSKEQLNGVERGGYIAGSAEQQPNGFLGLSGSSQELAKERSEVPKLMEEDYGEQPDPITVLAVGIL